MSQSRNVRRIVGEHVRCRDQSHRQGNLVSINGLTGVSHSLGPSWRWWYFCAPHALRHGSGKWHFDKCWRKFYLELKMGQICGNAGPSRRSFAFRQVQGVRGMVADRLANKHREKFTVDWSTANGPVDRMDYIQTRCVLLALV